MDFVCKFADEMISCADHAPDGFIVTVLLFLVKYLPALTPIVAFTAAGIALKSYNRQRRLHQEKLSFDFEFFYQNDSELKKHKANLTLLYKSHKKGELDLKYFANVNPDNEYSKSIMFVLNTWERCAHAIKEGLYDEDYLYNVFHIVALRAYTILEPYIDERRSQTGNEEVYIDFRWLAESWKIRRIINSYNEETDNTNKLISKASNESHKWNKINNYLILNHKRKYKQIKTLLNNQKLLSKRKKKAGWLKWLIK
ncbi:DUF4760 domain-containing protein [Pantoea ananatis]|uniref:DUF4760 domain-containing protein n=1 Tax=Pantoea ananas TaxID=553 RepID=UPI001FF39C16|nr:DUF4760 domain-containing protein [Pantoea ananatis]MCK0552021.1 DUF4760 domain-containing protein [Pantoea ananatis]